jgi:hypothetical protein
MRNKIFPKRQVIAQSVQARGYMPLTVTLFLLAAAVDLLNPVGSY